MTTSNLPDKEVYRTWAIQQYAAVLVQAGLQAQVVQSSILIPVGLRQPAMSGQGVQTFYWRVTRDIPPLSVRQKIMHAQGMPPAKKVVGYVRITIAPHDFYVDNDVACVSTLECVLPSIWACANPMHPQSAQLLALWQRFGCFTQPGA